MATTLAASAVSFNGATLNGTVKPNGLAATAGFQYGLTTAYGTSTANQNAGAGTGAVSVLSAIGNLMPNTVYHFRVVTTNSSGTTHGADQTFTTAADAVVGTLAERTAVRNLPAVAGRAVNVGAFTFAGNTGSMEIAVNVTGANWSVAKRYIVPIRYSLSGISPSNTWLTVLPAHDSGALNGNNFDLEMQVSGATATVRVKTTAYSAGTPVATIAIKTTGLQSLVNSTTTAAAAAPTAAVGTNAVTEIAGKAGFGATPADSAALDISGGNTRGLRLRPRTTAGAPASGTWNPGTIILDSAGNLYICTTAGTPGTWKKVGH